MEKPTEPNVSIKYVVEPKTVDTVLKTKIFVHEELTDEQDFLEYNDLTNRPNCEVLPWSYSETGFTVSEIMELCKGYDPGQVSLVIEREREITHIVLSLVHSRPVTDQELEEWRIEKNAAEAAYEEQYAEYVIEDHKYKVWLAEKELAEKKVLLNQLQNYQVQQKKLKVRSINSR